MYLSTSSKPFVIQCEGNTKFLCKSMRDSAPLICEVLCALMLEDWECPTPPFALVDIPEEIWMMKLGAVTTLKDKLKPCFGSLYLNDPARYVILDALDYITHLNLNISKENMLLFKKILKVSLFDLWVGNRDRKTSNQNVLIYMTEKNLYDFYPIDHEKCFMLRQIIHQPENAVPLTSVVGIRNTLLETPFVKNWIHYFLTKKRYKKEDIITPIIEELELFFYKCIEKCKQGIEKYLSLLPQEWVIHLDMNHIYQSLTLFLFHPDRVNAVWEDFCNHLTTERR